MIRILLVGLLLGLRHATDPDHLTAVSTLVLGDREAGARRAGRLGAVWGLGHAATLVALGTPVMLLGRQIPDGVHRGAEFAIGVLIALLAARLLLRWRRGWFITGVPRGRAPSDRSPLAAFALGLVHGVGGTAFAGVLVAASAADPGAALATLAVFAASTAFAMAVAARTLGHALGRESVSRSLPSLIPSAGVVALLFGLWYAFNSIAPATRLPT